MGVHPEPALCADDARRLVSGTSCDTALTAAGTARSDASLHGVKTHSRRLATLLLGLAMGAGLPTAFAHEHGADHAIAMAEQRSDLRIGEHAAEWGGVALRAGEPATQAVIENAPGSLPLEQDDPQTVRFGERAVPRPLVETILRASESTGVDPVYMMALADKESSFDTDVKASTSSAQGLFQFLTGTWLEMIRDYGAKHGLAEEAAAVSKRGSAGGPMRKRILALRNDPYVAGLMAGEMINRDRAKLESRIGRTLKTTELYLAHFLGTADAGKLLSLKDEAPEKSAKAVFGRAARANRTIFSQGGRSLTVAEVHERLDGMIDRRLSQFQAVAQLSLRESDDEHPEEQADFAKLDARLLRKNAVPPLVAPTVQ